MNDAHGGFITGTGNGLRDGYDGFIDRDGI